MKIIVNGENVEFELDSLNDLIEKLSLQGKVMAAAVNMEIVKQDEWKNFSLNDMDKVELLDFVGGG
jgi:sulfur carrier protein